jgi:PilZ domain
MSPTANLERRKNDRRRPPSLIYVELNANNGGMMRDLSEDGFALRAMMPLTVGDDAGFSFVLHGSIRIEGEGQVVWIEEKGKVGGIRFTNVSDHNRAEIQSWLSRIPEMQNGKETEESTAEPSRQSWNQLRDELLSSPSRPESPESKWDRETWPRSPGDAKEPTNEEREHEKDPIRFPGPSDFSATEERVESRFESRSGNKGSREQSRSSADGEKAGRTAAHPVLPDISKILMQPPNRASNYPPKAFEPLDPLTQTRELAERRGGWFTLSRAVIIMGVLALGVAGFAYRELVGEGLIWAGQQVSGGQIGPPTVPAPAVPPTTAPATKNESASAPTSSETLAKPTDTTGAEPAPATPAAGQQNTNAPAVQPDNDVSEAPPPVTKHTKTPPAAPPRDTSSESNSDEDQKSGMTEYSEAVRLLHGRSGTADPAEAARLLWISVEKGNSDAELALAELYWHGEGVPRNCDQARILLGAAVRKGNLAARTRLSEFERAGCE